MDKEMYCKLSSKQFRQAKKNRKLLLIINFLFLLTQENLNAVKFYVLKFKLKLEE